MRNLPPLAAVRAFEAAARHENYTRAGEELGLTQAAVSYQIRSLEQRVGMPLFARSGRKMELTAAGAALAPRIAQAFATMEGAFADLGADENSVLSIACFQTFATKLLAPRLGSFQIAHPEIAVRLQVSDAFVDLETGESDLAIRLSQVVASSLEAHELMTLEIAPFASPDFIKANVDLCAEDPPIPESQRISPNSAWWRAWDEGRCDAGEGGAGRGLPRGLQFDSQVLDAAAAASGNGVAIVSPEMFFAELADGRLQRVGERVVRPGAKYRLVYPEVRRHSAKVRAFREWLMAEFSEIFRSDQPVSR